jgi:hypothetical protein
MLKACVRGIVDALHHTGAQNRGVLVEEGFAPGDRTPARAGQGDEKAPGDAGGEVCVDGMGRNQEGRTPRRDIVIARRRRRPKKKPRLIRPGQVCLRAPSSYPRPRRRSRCSSRHGVRRQRQPEHAADGLEVGRQPLRGVHHGRRVVPQFVVGEHERPGLHREPHDRRGLP